MKALTLASGLILAGAFAVAVPLAAAHANPATPTVVVHTFTSVKNSGWPYDLGALRDQTVDRLKQKIGAKANVVTDAPAAGEGVYTLDVEIVSYRQSMEAHANSGGAPSSLQDAVIHAWLTDGTGKKLFDKKDSFEVPGADSFQQPDYTSPGPMAKNMEGDIVGWVNSTKIF